ncbi:MAG: radical SAM protein [Magnetococcales bacterium]|nr:radical SAM protein [Magnetococcales bacterium]
MHWKQRLKQFLFVRKLLRYKTWYLQDCKHLPRVEIETFGRCNRACSYCPVSTNEKRTGRMSRALFEKIIHDLAAIDFSGTLSFHFYNEPLLDKRLPELSTMARRALPKARFKLITNGDLLTREKLQELFDVGFDQISISLHDEEIEKKMMALVEELSEQDQQRTFLNTFFRPDTVLSNRGGAVDIPDASKSQAFPEGCAQAHNSLIIDYRGKVALCCNDFAMPHDMGDCNTMHVREILQKRAPLTKAIYFGRYNLEICKNCVELSRNSP